MRIRTTRWAAAGAAGCAAVALAVTAGQPATAASMTTLADHLVLPLGLSVTADGTSYVAQTGTNSVTRVTGSGARADVLTSKAPGVSGVVALGDGSIVYTYSIRPGEKNPIGQVRRQFTTGTNSILGFLGRYEVATNADHVNSYGFQGVSDACLAQVPDGIPLHYKGLRDTHPYALASLGNGSYAVADAGANSVLVVSPGQSVRTLAVLPPVPLPITSAIAQGLGLPGCTVGHAYNFEPVPTDVEKGPDGLLYVTSLAGGPEGPGVPLGGVFTVDPASGAVKRIAGGLSGATALAVSQSGRVYVAELFGNRVSYLQNGHAVPFMDLPLPGALEISRGKLYVTTDVLPPEGAAPNGKLVRIDLP